MPPATYEFHDKLLDAMTPYGCVLKNGFSNHAPMVVEALAAMAQGAHAPTWFEARKHTIQLRPVSKTEIDPDHWRDALGEPERFTDWVNFFVQQMSKRGWHATLARFAPHLAPGFLSAACHGIIRVGHAVRALQHKDTQARRRELAYALAAWCSDYQVLREQESPAVPYGPYNGNEILETLPLLDESARKNDGAITTAVMQLRSRGSFFTAIGQLQMGDIAASVHELAQTAAQVFLHNARTPLGAIVFTHGITSVAAASHVAAHLTPERQRALLFEGFQAIAALHCVYATRPFAQSNRQTQLTPEDLIAQAVSHGDDHVIKLTESCTRFYQLTGNPRLLLAAELGASLIPAHE